MKLQWSRMSSSVQCHSQACLGSHCSLSWEALEPVTQPSSSVFGLWTTACVSHVDNKSMHGLKKTSACTGHCQKNMIIALMLESGRCQSSLWLSRNVLESCTHIRSALYILFTCRYLFLNSIKKSFFKSRLSSTKYCIQVCKHNKL